MNKEILILVESVNPDDSSGVKGRLALINNLIKIGHQVKVFHLDENYKNDVNFEAKVVGRFPASVYFWLSKLNTFAKKLNVKLNKWVEPQFGFSFSHYEDVARFKKALTEENPDHYDIVFTLSKAASFRPHKAVLESSKWHDKWYAYIHDPYPTASYPRPYDWVEPGHQKKRNFFLGVFNQANKLVYPSLLLAEWMGSYYHNSEHKRLIIPHQIDNTVNIAERNEYFPKSRFTILHAGSLMSARKPYALVSAFLKLKQEFPELKHNSNLLFVGAKSCFHDYFVKVGQNHSELIHTSEAIPFSKVLRLQMEASVNVILEAKGPVSPFLPGKFPHCIIAKKPILLLGPYYSESKRLLERDKHLYWSEIDDEDLIFRLLKTIYQSWKTNSINCKYPKLGHYLSSNYLYKSL